MQNLPQALIALKGATIGQIRAYAADLEYGVRAAAFDTANGFTRGRFLDEEEWQDACQSADEAQNNAHHAAAPFRWIAFYSEVERASELFRALAEGWRRAEQYCGSGEWDADIEAQEILREPERASEEEVA